jgi:hypothetical protein
MKGREPLSPNCILTTDPRLQTSYSLLVWILIYLYYGVATAGEGHCTLEAAARAAPGRSSSSSSRVTGREA